MVLLFILLFVVFATVFMMLHISKVIALIYFKKMVKGLKKGNPIFKVKKY